MELGFGATGAWAAGWFDESRAEEVLRTALTRGITHFDTAGFYADGRADERLARALQRLAPGGAVYGRQLTVSTKIGKRIGPDGRLVRDFSEHAIRDAVERHTTLFGGHRPDIVYLHGPDEKERHGSLPLLQRLKADGLIGAIGECQDGPGLAEAVCTDGIDVVMARYHFLNTSHREAFRTAKRNGKKVISIAPLAQGMWRRGIFIPKRLSDVWGLARALIRDPKTLLAAQKSGWIRRVDGWPPAHLAMGFVRMNEAIDVVLTTSTRPYHLEEVADGFARDLPREIAALLSVHGAQ
ncbi:aldo/keto reductase [Parvularcula marina]|uniref:Aldo/keto reductase n=1 Tax=Parvularcula marina TaxID=2292771 RepID=A0A371RG62_9PROT|nr:aldo/keto reductase [Parvularcula marina]RFB04438.1 aldo/keto reductase [Parvularcula marina]